MLCVERIKAEVSSLTDELSHESEAAVLQNDHDVMTHAVEVLLAEASDLVLDLSGVVQDEEGVVAHLRRCVEVVVAVLSGELAKQRLVVGARKAERSNNRFYTS